MKKVVLFLSIMAGMTACKKDNAPADKPAPKNTYLKSEVIDVFNGTTTYTLSSTYTYDSQNRVSGIVETSTNTSISPNRSSTNFVYNSKGKLESFQGQYISGGTTYAYKYTYIYTDAGIVQEMTTTNLATNIITQRNTYEYTNNGLIYRFVQPSGTVSQTSIFTFNKDNVAQIEYKNQSGTTVSIQNYAGYDTKPNPLQMKWASIPDKLRSVNNCTTETRTITSTGVATTAQYSYEYNADGYPTKRTDNASGRTAIWTYEKR